MEPISGTSDWQYACFEFISADQDPVLVPKYAGKYCLMKYGASSPYPEQPRRLSGNYLVRSPATKFRNPFRILPGRNIRGANTVQSIRKFLVVKTKCHIPEPAPDCCSSRVRFVPYPDKFRNPGRTEHRIPEFIDSKPS
jgi:hypothetical protein